MAKQAKQQNEEQVQQQNEEQDKEPEQEQVQCRVQDYEHSEARYLAFTEVYCQGVEWHLTMREGVTGGAIVEFLENLSKVTAWVGKQKGWSFKPGGYCHPETFTAPAPKRSAPKRASVKNVKPAPPITEITSTTFPPSSSAPPAELPLATSEGAAVGDVIDVKLMSRHTSDDGEREYYRVKGGRYMKFGVRCWPEIAETLSVFNIEAASMVLGQSYNLADFNLVAHFVRNDEGNVSKIVKFEVGE
jgi:hypothetical protein